MIIMIHQARVSGCHGSLAVASLVFLAAGVVTAAAAGFVLGAFGSQLDGALRAALACLAAVAVVTAALRQERPWQLNRDTALSSLRFHDWRTAALNGAELGAGFPTRVGFWLWYAIPLGAFAAGQPVMGALLYVTYAGTRLGCSLAIARLDDRDGAAAARARARSGALRPVLGPMFLLAFASIVATQVVAIATT